MSKRSLITNITPLPAHITREIAIALLHNHVEMIELNPLVIRHCPTEPPANTTPEEKQHMKWYALTDMIQYIPGTALKGEVTYKAGFFDLPRGLQTHCFAAGGVELQGKWSVGGNEPGEEREPAEIGVQKPRDGLYIREDVSLKCNVLLTSFVKKNLKKSHGVLVQRLVQNGDSLREIRMQNATLKPAQATSAGSTQEISQQGANLSRDSIQQPQQSISEWRAQRAHAVQQPERYAQLRRQVSDHPPPPQGSPGYSGQAGLSANSNVATNVREGAWPSTRSKSGPFIAPSDENTIVMELEGDPVLAQRYYAYQAQRSAELE